MVQTEQGWRSKACTCGGNEEGPCWSRSEEVFVMVWGRVETCSAQQLKSAAKNSLYTSLASQNESPPVISSKALL